MNRRGFLAMAAALTGVPVPLGAEFASNTPARRAAVVIGVNNPRGLPPLSAAASSAQEVAAWLHTQKFEVTLLTDDKESVTSSAIIRAVNDFVTNPSLELLLVYFSGHGFLLGQAEFWLLSEALHNSNEAVNLEASIKNCRDCGIPNIVFISDACRSTVTSLNAQNVTGSNIFPSSGTARAPRAEVDRFYATLPGDPAYEVAVDKTSTVYRALYTSCFLEAFQHPDANAKVVVVLNDGTRVIPDRRLKPYLLEAMRRRAGAAHQNVRQDPDAIIELGEETYIGWIAENTAVATPPSAPPSPTLSDVATVQLAELDVFRAAAPPVSKGVSPEAIAELATLSGFNASRDTVKTAQAFAVTELKTTRPSANPLTTGVIVSGTFLVDLIPSRNVRPRLVSPGTAHKPTIFQVDVRERTGGSVLVQFEDGSGVPIAVLRNYIATVVVESGRVINVSYLPSEGVDDRTLGRLDDLHAVVGTSVRFGVFRVSGDKETRTRQAEQVADRIRVLKAVDPVLGMYAAYAYTAAGLTEQVRSVHRILLEDGILLFDIAMLAGEFMRAPSRVVPFTPMLAQGWALLEAFGVEVPGVVAAARPHLRGALWTTFDREGAQMLAKALSSGELL